MALRQLLQIVCDECGGLLKGKDRMDYIAKPYISIRGQVSLQNEVNPANSQTFYVSVTKKEENDHAWCSVACLTRTIERRKKTQIEFNAKERIANAKRETDNGDYQPHGFRYSGYEKKNYEN